MSAASDDITPLFLDDEQPRIRLSQGRLVGWNTASRQNVVLYRGAELTDLPVLETGATADLREGDNVSLLATGRSYLILGKVSEPTTPPPSGG